MAPFPRASFSEMNSVTPPLPSRRSSQRTPPTVPLALLLLLVVGGGFFGLLTFIFPGAAAVVLVALVLGLLFVAQYFIWGRWLYRVAVRWEATAEAERNSSANDDAP